MVNTQGKSLEKLPARLKLPFSVKNSTDLLKF